MMHAQQDNDYPDDEIREPDYEAIAEARALRRCRWTEDL